VLRVSTGGARAGAWLAVALWALLAAGALPVAAQVTRYLQAENLEVAGSPSVWADDRLALLRPPATAGATLAEGLGLARAQALAARAGIPASWLHPTVGGTLLLPPPGTPLGAVAGWLAAASRAGASVQPVDDSSLGREIAHDSEETLHTSSAIAVPLLVLLLPLVFGAALQAALPLVVAAVGAELALAVVSVLERHVTLSVYLTDIVTFLALGVGVDYALFVTTRFREALDRGARVPEARAEAMRTAGRSVLFSGLAVCLATATLVVAGTSYWRGLALGGAVAVASVLLATHTLLPALLELLGPRVLWGRVPFGMQGWSLWPRLAAWSTWRPALSVAVGLALLAIPAAFGPGLRVAMPADLARMLPRGAPLRVASELAMRLEGAGSLSPIPVALELPTPVTDPATWSVVARATEDLRHLPDVASVASPTDAGAPPAALAAVVRAAGSDPAALGPLAAFVAPSRDPHLVALVVTPASGPDRPETARLLDAIRSTLGRVLPRGARAAAGGAVALLRDFNHHTERRLPWVVGLAALVALVVLWTATGSLLQAAVGVLLDGVVALATAGILVLTVQHGALGLEAEPPNLTVTPLIFVLLFGLSMDYEVILLHRVQEVAARGLPMAQAAREGIAATGGMITGAGLVMVVAFVVLLASPLEILQTLAIGMTAAILLDTWVVRSFLIPGIVALLGPRAFWPWRPRPDHGR
jgi:uncharacterized membrane protein YdfJ with MMPL/SSD domain